jgi:pyridoxine 5-phosphate synthase
MISGSFFKPMATLCVNIDHIATLRQARRGSEPDPVLAVHVVERGGSSGVTVHLRQDERHIQERDVRLIRRIVAGHLNLEMASSPAIVAKALDIVPDVATLVPERREELTTEGGLDVLRHLTEVREATARLQDAGIIVSLFIDPEAEQVDAARRCGARQVEFHTGQYANARGEEQRRKELLKLYSAAEYARQQGIVINAGHGLNYHNTQPVAAIPGLRELNIGHSIISRAVFEGLRNAVAEMALLIGQATRHPEAYRPER